MSAAGVGASTTSVPEVGLGASPTAALHALQVRPLPCRAAKALLVRHHYLHSIPGGTTLAFGVLVEQRLLGAVALGAGPAQVHRLVDGASREDVLVLTRLWLDDALPRNSESRVLGILARHLRRHTEVKVLISYTDPVAGHVGTIYQATGWLYTGVGEGTVRYDMGDGVLRHSRSLGASLGIRSVRVLARLGVQARAVQEGGKHRYVLFLDPAWRTRLRVPVLPYPGRKTSPAEGEGA